MTSTFEWTIIGGGPAGIAAIGLLLDAGVDGGQIGWIDPKFCVGDFGTAWRHVQSNTPVSSFLRYLQTSAAFQFEGERERFFLERLPTDKQCPLKIVVQPLQWITTRLKAQVQPIEDTLIRLTQQDALWRLMLGSGKTMRSRKVVLAFGAEPKMLQFPELQPVPLAVALDPELLRSQSQSTDQLVLFGDAQSARSVLVNLKNVQGKKPFHFYHSENTLKRHMNPEDLSDVESMPVTPSHLLRIIPQCNKVIYAIGFERRSVRIDGLPMNFGYDRETGIIAPGIYGVGLAFPEVLYHEMGRPEHKVAALLPVIKGLQKRLPLWLSQ